MTTLNASAVSSSDAAPRTGARTTTMRPIAAWTAQLSAVAVFAAFGPVAKLTGDPVSVALFTELGVEPFGRFGVATAEILAVLLLVMPRTAVYGGVMTLGIMAGAIFGHVTKLGISLEHVPGGGEVGVTLFAAAVLGLIAGGTVTFLRRRELPVIGPRLP